MEAQVIRLALTGAVIDFIALAIVGEFVEFVTIAALCIDRERQIG